jgi:hypothetical protein
MIALFIRACIEISETLAGIQIDVITPEEAAQEILARKVEFKWRPVIVESIS